MKTKIITILAATVGCQLVSAADTDHLIRLYEEEILAHDLYVELGEEHPNIRPFQNIPKSEARHQAAMKGILDQAGIAIPKPENGRKFVTPGLNRTYRTWLKEGKKSPVDACRVGVRLEEHDIADLRKAAVEHPRYRGVLEQLEAASGHHLRAFHRNLTALDGTYQAEALEEADLKKLLTADGASGCGSCKCGNEKTAEAPSATRRGPQGRMGNGGPRNRQRGQGRR